MKTKRMIAGLIAAMTLASVSASAVVTAADDFSVSISKTEAAAGESFELTLDLTNIPSTGINACDFGISYDSSLVTIDEVNLGSLAKDVSSVEGTLPEPFECNIETGVISVMYALGTTDSAYFLNGTGTFLNISGTVKADAAAGSDAEFKIVPVDRAVTPGSSTTNSTVVFGYMSADETTTVYEPVFTAGNVHVIGGETEETTEPATEPDTTPTTEPVTEDLPDGTMYGDVNLDQRVNVSDVVTLNMYLLNTEANALQPEGKANADCVRDNVIDSADSALILGYVAGTADVSELGK